MPEYQLKIRQSVDYPRCRICRQFIQALMADRNIRTLDWKRRNTVLDYNCPCQKDDTALCVGKIMVY